MTQVRKIFVLLLVVAVTCCMATTAFAATNTQDGIEVTLTTDKTEYSSGEEIIVTLIVTNTNDTAVTNVSLESLIPEGYKLADDSAATKQIDILNYGESITLTVTYMLNTVTGETQPKPEVTTQPKPEVTTQPESEVTTQPKPEVTAQPNAGDSGNESVQPDIGNNNEENNTQTVTDDDGESNPSTGVDSNIVLLAATLLITVIVIIVVRKLDKKKRSTILSFFLCLVIAGTATVGLLPVQTKPMLPKIM